MLLRMAPMKVFGKSLLFLDSQRDFSTHPLPDIPLLEFIKHIFKIVLMYL